MMVVTVAVKTLRELVRQPKSLGLALGLPVVFMLIFGLAFGNEDPVTYRIGVVNGDEGDLGASFAEGLGNLTYGSGVPIVALSVVGDVESGRAALQDRSLHAVVVIPANFSANLMPSGRPAGALPLAPTQAPPSPAGAGVDVWGDPASARFSGASQVVAAFALEFGERASGRPAVVRTEARAVTAAGLTEFDFIAPGLMVFAVLNLAPQVAAILARESELRTLDRIRASPLRAVTLLAGIGLASLVLAAASVVLMLATAEAMGFHNQGSWGEAFLIVMASAFAVIGVGLVIAAFARTQQEASNLGIMVSVPASFLSGAFFEIPAVTLFTWNGWVVGLYDVLPTKHAVEAMRTVMTYGGGLDAVTGLLAALAGLAVVYFAVGVAFYGRARLAPE